LVESLVSYSQSYQCGKESVCGDQAYTTPDDVDAGRPDHLKGIWDIQTLLEIAEGS
jgi:hypothetical protein